MQADRQRLTGLVARALALADPDSEDRWSIVRELHDRGDRLTFEVACALAQADEPVERVLGIDVLGQLGYRDGRPFAAETLPVLVAAADDERVEVAAAAIVALGHLGDQRARARVLRHVGSSSARVRFALAVALPALAGDPAAPDAVIALIELTRDSDAQVRDWATMGLGSQLDVDTSAVRDALAARIDDEGDIAGEALLGLARRRDRRALAPVLALLAGTPGNLIVEAAGELGAAEALPALHHLKATGWQHRDSRPALLDDALRACTRTLPDRNPT